MTEVELAAEMDRIERGDDWLARGVAAALFLGWVIFALGCAAHRAPDGRPTPPSKVEARLTYTPELPTHFNPITITARLVVPPGVSVPCPRITWTLPDGTHAVHAADCDPDDDESGRTDIKRGWLPAGEHEFSVTFDSQGHAWSVRTTVPVL